MLRPGLRGATRSLLHPALFGDTQAPASTVFDTTGFDQGTLVSSNLASSEYVNFSVLGLPAATAEDYDDPTDGACYRINPAGTDGSSALLYGRFVAPPGCTSVTVRVRAKLDSGNTHLYVGIWDAGGGTPVGYVGGTYTTIDGTMTDYSDSFAVTAGNEYALFFQGNVDGAQTIIVESARVEPVGGSGLFAGTFYRLPLVHETALLDTFPDRWRGDGTLDCLALCSPGARWDVLTDATAFAVEAYGATTYDDVSIEVDGEVETSTAHTGYQLQTFSLAAGTRRVSVVVPPIYTAGELADGASVNGTFPRAFYVGTCATLQASALTTPATRVLVYGDSISCGYTTSLGLSHWALLRRAGTCTPLLLAGAGAELFFDGADATARQTFVDALATLDFDVIWLAIGTNDYGSADWANVAAFEAAYEDLLDKLIAAYPAMGIYAQTPTSRTDLGTNGHGETLAQYRTAITNAASGKATVTVVDGATLLDTANTTDGVHPDDAGAVEIAAGITTAL
jgi:lysophospholipase L1-like esterase